LSVKRPVTFFMVFIALVAIGVVAFRGLKMDLFPQLELPVIAVITGYSGTSPEDIESLITRPIEGTIATVENLDTLSSQSKEGLSLVMAEFAWGTDMDIAERHIRGSVDLIKSFLPDEAGEPLIFKFDPTLMPIMGISVSGKNDLAQIRKIAEDEVTPRLERIEGVASAEAMGGEVREIQVQVDRERLTSRGVTLGQLMNTIRRENVVIPAGTIEEGKTEYTVRTLGEYRSVEQIADTAVTYQGNIPIYVKDVADVVDGSEEQHQITRVNGKPAVVVILRRASGANTVEVSDRVLSQLPEIENSVKGIGLSVVFQEAEPIKESMANLFNTIILAVVLCGVVLFVFLRTFRSTIVVLISIPVSIIATFIAMNLFGITMNIVSMGGLALGVGLFVDNSIVVLESIFRHREKGEPAQQGSIIGSSEVATAITASTLTTICVFFPILFVPGIAGQLFRDMALTITFSLLISLGVALTLVPLLSSRILKVSKSEDKGSYFLGEFIGKVTSIYERMLGWCLTNRIKILTIIGVVFLLSMLLFFKFVGISFIPEMDTGSINVNIRRPAGTSLEETDKTFQKAERIIREEVPELKIMATSLGAGKGFQALMSEGSHGGSIWLELVDRDKREKSAQEIEAQLRPILARSLPEAKVKFTSPYMGMAGMGGTTGADIEIYGYDLAELRKVSSQVEEVIKEVPGAMDIENSIGEARPQLSLSYNRDKLYDLSLSTSYVSQLVKTAIQGSVASRYKEKGKEYNILLRMKEKDRSKIEDIGKLKILTPKGGYIEVGDVVDINYTQAPLEIERKNQHRIADVSFRAAGRSLGDVLSEVETNISKIDFPPDFRWAVGGSGEDMRNSFRWLGYALIVAMFLVYMVMASEFESLRDPFIMFITIPLSLMGVAWMLFVTGTTLSIFAMVGIIMLVGIVINNSIVLVDYTNLLRQRGKNIQEGVREAGRIRFRPVLMTALTTILAMTPLALQIGPGAEDWAPMARSVIGGLLAGIFITLLIIPVIYTLFEERKEKRKVKA
ncbi:MAG: efflux RND transporter permease subunit, partial [Candidatus Aerophobetes bacterium]|nr:efflux RND transporter permease subunit [Candidatus Aerophobetes bacterium]